MKYTTQCKVLYYLIQTEKYAYHKPTTHEFFRLNTHLRKTVSSRNNCPEATLMTSSHLYSPPRVVILLSLASFCLLCTF